MWQVILPEQYVPELQERLPAKVSIFWDLKSAVAFAYALWDCGERNVELRAAMPH